MNENLKISLVNFFEKYPVTRYKTGEIIFRPNESTDKVVFVKNGYARIYSHDSEGKEITYSGFKPLFLMSLNYCLKNSHFQYTCQALTEVEVWKAPIGDFLAFVEKDSKILVSLVSLGLNSLESAMVAWENSVSGDAYNRVARLILSLGKMYSDQGKDIVEFDFKITHQMVASMLGITRETASIQIKKLENGGWISQKKHLTILDYKKMEKNFC